MAIEWIPSPNFGVRRGKIDKIIIHHTAAPTIESTIDWFQRKESQRSAHYIVGMDGRIVQMVNVSDVAWHCYGNNAKSIGIEVVNVSGPLLIEQEIALCYVLDMLMADHGLDFLAITAHRYVGHRPTQCPGDLFAEHGGVFEWAKKRFYKEQSVV